MGNSVPTARELLDGVRARRKSAIQSATDSSKTSVGSDWFINTKDRPSDERPHQLADANGSSPDTTKTRGRGENGTADTIRLSVGENGGSNSSTNQRDERATTDATEPTTTTTSQPPITRKSKFAPFQQYTNAIKDSINKTKTKAAPKSKSKVLTDTEIRYIREKLIEVLLWQSDHFDQLIIATTKGHMPIVIWSDIDRDDATLIANYLLDRGKEDHRVAHAVRQMVQLMDKIKLGLILVPRAYRTILAYLERGLSLR